MSDETVNYETNNPDGGGEPVGGSVPPGKPTAFCQDCGTPLNEVTMRNVGTGVFCEPCLTARVAGAVPGGGFASPAPGDAHPVLAGFLGIIPGVGAMYNGQYAKGVFHLLVFVVLSSLASHVSDIFKLLCFFWFCYQIIDAYQTAKARQEGRPLPNPFGFNEIGERMGFTRSWPTGGATWGAAPSAAAGTNATAPPAAAPYTAPVSGPGWVGYVPPSNFSGAPVPPPAAAQGGSWGQTPYSQTYAPYTPQAAYVPPVVVTPPVVPVRRFPVGAAWLVGLGLVFLLAEFAPEWGWDWNVGGRWLLPLLFAGLAVWMFTRRLAVGVRSVRGFRASIILMTLAVLFAFQVADVAGLHRTWPVFLIVLGVLLIAERTALNTAAFAGSAEAYTSFVPANPAEAEAEAARTRATWAAAPAEPEIHPDSGETSLPRPEDSGKGGY